MPRPPPYTGDDDYKGEYKSAHLPLVPPLNPTLHLLVTVQATAVEQPADVRTQHNFWQLVFNGFQSLVKQWNG